MSVDERFAHRFHARHRKPRVNLSYKVERYGAEKQISLPFVVGVLGDFAGCGASRGPFRERNFVEVDVDNFNEVMEHMRPTVEVQLDEGTTVTLEFRSLDDFAPQGLISRVPALSGLWELRQSLLSPDQLEPESLVALLSANGLSDTLAMDDDRSFEVARGSVESRLSSLLRAFLQDPGFRQLESSWRGLRYLVVQTETSEELKIRVLDITKKELARDLDKSVTFDQSFIFKKVYEAEFALFGGEPFGVLIGDYGFSHAGPDVHLLTSISNLAAAASAPFVSAASAAMFGMESLPELASVRSLARIFEAAEYSAWNAFRDSEDARWVVLTVPQILMRAPHHYRSEGAPPFVFTEVVEDKNELLWGNAAFGLAACMTRAYAQERWVSHIHGADGGGRVENLPMASITSDDGSRDKLCATFLVSDRREYELSDAGFAALCQAPAADEAVFFGVPSCQRPRSYDSAEATGNARILSQIPTTMICARFAHYLKAIARDWVGTYKERGDFERRLNDWLATYVSGEPVTSDEERARYPLREARVEVAEMPGRPGPFQAVVYMRPQYGLKGLDVSLRFSLLLPRVMSA